MASSKCNHNKSPECSDFKYGTGMEMCAVFVIVNKHTIYHLWYLKIIFTLIKFAVRKDKYDEVMLVCP
jgi:hypothetical protein